MHNQLNERKQSIKCTNRSVAVAAVSSVKQLKGDFGRFQPFAPLFNFLVNDNKTNALTITLMTK